MAIALSKCYDPADFTELGEELAVVQAQMGSASPQHGIREWEYAMALHAAKQWAIQQQVVPKVVSYDIGGAGSPFSQMAGQVLNETCCRIDPAENWPLEKYLETDPPLRRAVFCISVLEHVPDLDSFCYHLACLTAPGGLLFLTMDYQPDESPDTKMFHWMRERIFTPRTWGQLATHFIASHHFSLLGERDPVYHGDFDTWGYSSATLALVKRA